MKKEALLVIDMLNDFVKEGAPLEVSQARKILPPLKKEIEKARKNKEPIIYICDAHRPQDKEFERWPPHAILGTPGQKVVEEISPRKGDFVVYKRRFSGFSGTELDLLLRELGVEKLKIAGILTNICVFLTSIDALNLGYEVEILKDCVASTSPRFHNFALEELEEVFKIKLR